MNAMQLLRQSSQEAIQIWIVIDKETMYGLDKSSLSKKGVWVKDANRLKPKNYYKKELKR